MVPVLLPPFPLSSSFPSSLPPYLPMGVTPDSDWWYRSDIMVLRVQSISVFA